MYYVMRRYGDPTVFKYLDLLGLLVLVASILYFNEGAGVLFFKKYEHKNTTGKAESRTANLQC